MTHKEVVNIIWGKNKSGYQGKGCKVCGEMSEQMVMVTKEGMWRGDDEVHFLCRKHSSFKLWKRYENEMAKERKKLETKLLLLKAKAHELVETGVVDIRESDCGTCMLIEVNGN